MPLKLTITSYQRLSPGQETTKTLDRGSVSIGRAPKNDWVLQDPERILSSEHCVVHYKDGGYVLTDKSTNGTFLNDSEQRIPREHTVPLKDGDRFVLGEYEIEATLSATEEEEVESFSSLMEHRCRLFAAPSRARVRAARRGCRQRHPGTPPRKPSARSRSSRRKAAAPPKGPRRA